MIIGDDTGDLHVALYGDDALARPAVLLPCDSLFEFRLDVAKRFHHRLHGRRTNLLPPGLQLTALHRARLILLLHAFDIHEAGGGPRDVAAALINAEEASLAAIEWKSSAVRRRANRLIEDAIGLVNGGYLALLRGS